jgi:membrane protease YdiL (CAAX protease family)
VEPVPSEPSPPIPTVSGIALATRLGVLLLLLFLTVCQLVQSLNIGFGLWFTEVFVFLGVSWVALRNNGRDPLEYPRTASPGWPAIALGFLAGALNFAALVIPLQWISQAFAPAWLRELFDSTRIFANQTPFEMVAIMTAIGIAAPVCEEYYFRGILQQGLTSAMSRTGDGVALTAIIFSAFHLDPIGFLARAELGALFGYLLLRTGSLWPGVAAHAANNLISTALYFAFKDAAGGAPDEDPSPVLLAALVAGGTPLVLMVARMAAGSARLRPSPRLPPGPTPPFHRLAAPWLAGGLASLALLLAVDARGVRLSYYDFWVAPLPMAGEHPPEEEKRQRDALDALRKAARKGDVPLEKYLLERRQLAEWLRHSNL